MNDENGSEHCGKIIPELVLSVINSELKVKLVKIIFDDFYKADYKFRVRSTVLERNTQM